MKTQAMHTMEINDAGLVTQSQEGSRDAFRQIVERYKILICSLAYSGTGSVSQSEDLAQETFLAAWTDLHSLREPTKLRAWLCGIVRNRIRQSLRREGREPARWAMPLEDAHDVPAHDASPSDQAIRGTNLAEVHGLLPSWVVPLATFALLAWIGAVLAFTRAVRIDSPWNGSGNGRGNRPGRFLFSALIAVALSQTVARSETPPTENSTGTDPAIPDIYRPLYEALDETLRQDIQAFPYKKANGRPLIAANLGMAWSMYDPAAAGSQRWMDLLATLDAYQGMSMDAVFVQIEAPDLTFGDPESRIDFYRRLAREVRSRKLRLYVELFVNNPFKPNLPSGHKVRKDTDDFAGLHDDPRGRQEFLDIMEHEATLIYREIKPDYLTLIDEPGISIIKGLHLSFSADELAAWVGAITAHLKNSGASPGTLLGAGAITWEPEAFVLKFARQACLDYVDIHLYSLTVKGENQVDKLAAWIRDIRTERPEMGITIGETWLSKLGAGAPNVATPMEIISRNNFGFWSTLDGQFLDLLMGVSQQGRISVVAPTFSQYFFNYAEYVDKAPGKEPEAVGAGLSATWNDALKSIRDHQLSSTGKRIREILSDGKK